MLCLDQDVQRRDRPGNEIEHDLCQADSHSHPDQASQSPDQRRLADHETEDLGSGRTDCPEHTDFPSSLDHRGGDRIVDQKHSDDEGDEAESRQVEMEGGDHLLNLTAPGFGPSDFGSLRNGSLEISLHRVEV